MMLSTTRGKGRFAYRLAVSAVLASLAIGTSGCAGSAGSGANGGKNNSGFAFGSSDEEVKAAIEGLEKVSLKYQPATGNPESPSGQSAKAFKNAVEKRSNHQIEIEIIWGQAVADFPEVPDALIDGRLDIAQPIFVYDPKAFPVFNALSNSLTGLPVSPVVGEAVDSAVTSHMAWKSEELINEFKEKGLTPLNAMKPSGALYAFCAEENKTPDDYRGDQVRVSSSAARVAAQNVGMTPISMSHTETYEALQRGTIDCTFAQFSTTVGTGILDVAPHVSATTQANSIAARPGVADLAGSTFEKLPLPYKQIIFDAANIEAVETSIRGLTQATADGMKEVNAGAGSYKEMPKEIDESIGSAERKMRDKNVSDGLLAKDFSDQLEKQVDEWSKRTAEFKLKDGGSVEAIDSWWDASSGNYRGWAEEIFKSTAAEHRPK